MESVLFVFSAPLFVFQWLFDEAQMRADSIEAPITKEQWNYIHEMGAALRTSLDNVTAVFAPSCIGHSVLTKRDWTNIKVDGISLAEAMRCWEISTSRKNKSRRASKDRQQQQRHESTQIHTNKETKASSNVFDEMVEGHINGSGTLLRHQRHRSGCQNSGKCRTKEERIRRRQNMTAEEREQRRQNRIRRRHRNNGSNEMSPQFGQRRNQNKLERGLKKSQRKNNQTMVLLERNTPNSYKIRQSDQTSRPNRNNRTQNSSNNRNRGQQRQNENKREKRRNHTKDHDNARRAPNQNRKIREPERCSLRLLERCSWPQCNHSCPALTNPLTGEEVRFLELLTSFGLDIEAVATALGIDTQTLHNMDQAELVNLLTQQVS